MKKFLILAVITLVFLPVVTLARVDSPEVGTSETVKIEKMKQIIVLLQTYLAYLQQSTNRLSLGAPLVLGVSTSTATTTDEKKKRRGGGGGGGGSSLPVVTQPLTLVVDMLGATNTFSVTANQPLSPTDIKIILTSLPPDVVQPNELSLKSILSSGAVISIPLINIPGTLEYTADLRARIGQGDNWSGAFTVVFPSSAAQANIPYTVTFTTNGVSRAVNLENIGVGAKGIVFSVNDENPDSTVIIVQEDESTPGIVILGYDIQPQGGFVHLERLYVNIEASEPVFDVIDDARLLINDKIFDLTEIIDSGDYSDTSVLVGFDVDVFLKYNQLADVRLEVDIQGQNANTYPNGTTLRAGVEDEVGLTLASGDEQLGVSDMNGEVIGNTFKLDSRDLLIDSLAWSTDTQGLNDTTGVFEIEFELSARDDDFYIHQSANVGGGSGGFLVSLETPAGFISASSVVSTAITSTADQDSPGVFTLGEGTTETFTVWVTVDPNVTGMYRVGLTGINYSLTPGGGTRRYTPLPAEEFRTNFIAINN